MTKATRALQSLMVPALAIVLGILVGTLATRAYFPDPARPEWWRSISAGERRSLQGTARKFLELDKARREEFVSLHRVLTGDSAESKKARRTVSKYEAWVAGLSSGDRAIYDSASDTERAELFRQHGEEGWPIAEVEGDVSGDESTESIPPVPRLTDTQIMNVFHRVERSLELTEEETSKLDQTLGMNRVWLTLTLSLREAHGGRSSLTPLWPPIRVARQIAESMPEGAVRTHLVSLREKDVAKWIGRTIAMHLNQDMNRLIRDLSGEEGLPRLNGKNNRLSPNRWIATEERFEAASKKLGVSVNDLRLTVRWVIQTSGRGGNGQVRPFGHRPPIRENPSGRPAPGDR